MKSQFQDSYKNENLLDSKFLPASSADSTTSPNHAQPHTLNSSSDPVDWLESDQFGCILRKFIQDKDLSVLDRLESKIPQEILTSIKQLCSLAAQTSSPYDAANSDDSDLNMVSMKAQLENAYREIGLEKENLENFKEKYRDATLLLSQYQSKNIGEKTSSLNQEKPVDVEETIRENIALKQEINSIQVALSKAEKQANTLRQHLMEVESNHTQETLQWEKQKDSMNLQIEMQATEINCFKKNSEKVSNQASQMHSEMQSTLKHLHVENDQLKQQISALEQEKSGLSTAMSNLQRALEQFQMEQEEQVNIQTSRLRIELRNIKDDLEDLKSVNEALQTEMDQVKGAKEELEKQISSAEAKTVPFDELLAKNQKLEKLLHESHRQLKKALSPADHQFVDKRLIRNLLLSYWTLPKKTEIIDLLSKILDFSDAEKATVGISNSALKKGWASPISYITGFVPAYPSSTDSPVKKIPSSDESLSELFVKFLLEETTENPSPEIAPTPASASKPSSLQQPSSDPQMVPSAQNIANISPTPAHLLIEPSSTSQDRF